MSIESGILGEGRPVRRFLPAPPEGSAYYRMTSESPDDLTPMLEPIRTRTRVPALGAILVVSNRVVAMGAVGLRRHGSNVEVTITDKWHHGSITKSMTATAAAVLVERGQLRWSATMGELLGPLLPSMDEAWKPVTLDQLLRHRGGAPNASQIAGVWATLWNHTGSPQQQRLAWLELIASRPPPNPPGGDYQYSNAGYVFAGMMLEQVTGKSWEESMVELVFRPLQMDSAGFGVPATPRFLDQPWGHQWNSIIGVVDDLVRIEAFLDQPWGHQWNSGVPRPVPPGNDSDNPAGMGPAGTVHCTLLDLARYGTFHAREGRGEASPLISPGNFSRLHEALSGETYALGWSTGMRPWAGGRVISHSGSNVQWYTNVWIAPLKQAVLIAVTNIGDNTGTVARDTTNDVITALINSYLR